MFASAVSCQARPVATASSGPSHSARRPHPPKALSFAPHEGLSSGSYSSSSGMAPSCAWAPPAKPAHAQPQHTHGVWATLLGSHTAAPAQTVSTLPPEMDRVMRFTDGPGAAEQEPDNLLLRLWRYQGP